MEEEEKEIFPIALKNCKLKTITRKFPTVAID